MAVFLDYAHVVIIVAGDEIRICVVERHALRGRADGVDEFLILHDVDLLDRARSGGGSDGTG